MTGAGGEKGGHSWHFGQVHSTGPVACINHCKARKITALVSGVGD